MAADRLQPSDLDAPIVQAPLAGGPSTPALAIAVAEAGGLGTLAAGYKTPDAVAAEIAEIRAATDRPFGVNLFAPPATAIETAAVARYVEALRAGGLEPLGEPRHDDDAFAEKLDVLEAQRPAVVSFTFGCPSPAVVDRMRSAGCAVWVTITTPAEAATAAGAGADALVVQGVEAGGHRGSFSDAAPGDIGLLSLLQLVGAWVGLPMVAAGGIMTGRAIAAVLAAGADAAQLGSAFMRTPEAATSAPHRAALAGGGGGGDRPTGLTRAFSGRTARGIVNRFQREHPDAPSAYPEVHHVTSPLRAAARRAGDAESINLWAGQAYPLAREVPAAQLVRELAGDARARLRELS
ncbi:nitronate monooxygenase [Capillimicrobium parvum]|uniref:Propionate 3-nitronate monooxygenase n=1 Tax=Capillimicrobium parvum TaxID=2884022 RepID=A0A9E6XZD1_9ACTN|nr:nitronate monooxygenase [Capillimicrobium parvum]UGS36833.1 Nitronate monooxygenase [Capillimicrobium parvum]